MGRLELARLELLVQGAGPPAGQGRPGGEPLSQRAPGLPDTGRLAGHRPDVSQSRVGPSGRRSLCRGTRDQSPSSRGRGAGGGSGPPCADSDGPGRDLARRGYWRRRKPSCAAPGSLRRRPETRAVWARRSVSWRWSP
jgi:hypothetical protein